MPIWSAVAAAAPAVIGGLFGSSGQDSANRTNIRLAREQMEFQSAQAARQMDFQERMSSTSHQRETKDLLAAGLNPMLAFAKGSAGASTPAGGAGQGALAHVSSARVAGLNLALGVQRQLAEIRNINAQTAKSVAETETVDRLREPQASKIDAEIDNLTASATTMRYLREYTAKHLGAQAERELAAALESRSRSSLNEAQRILTDLEVAIYRRDSEFAKTWFGQKVQPLLRALSPAAPFIR